MGNSESKSKAIGGTVGGVTTAATVGTGIGLMFLGPIGIIAGGVLLGAGISSGVNTAQQCATKGEFRFGQWGVSVGIGALGGAVAAPLSAAGGVAAAAMTGTAARVTTVLTAEAVGGALSGGTMNTVTKAANGEEVSWKDFGTGAVIGAVTGAVGAGAGQAAESLAVASAKTVGELTSKTATATRIAVRATAGAATGSGVAAIAQLIENAITKGEIKKSNFFELMSKSVGAEKETIEKLWAFLCENEVIVNETVKKSLPESLEFPDEIASFKPYVRSLVDYSLDITKGVAEAAAIGATTGAVLSVCAGLAQDRARRNEVKGMGSRRAVEVTSGAHGGTVEAEAYARMKNTRIAIHCDDGSVVKHGEKSAKETIHLYYDTKEKHYSPADSSGKKLPMPPEASTTYGDCFFESVGYHTGEDAAAIRNKTAKFEKEKALELIGIKLDDFEKGGDLIGAGLSKDEYAEALNAVATCDAAAEYCSASVSASKEIEKWIGSNHLAYERED
ncbi:mucin-19-like [Oscarella lobularis]|uniref:mucin-19-like n=1 Tax=Oscarella lobularis TaxID=121494 RepID=UPI003313FF1E